MENEENISIENLVIYDVDAMQRIDVGDGVFAIVKPFSDELYLQNREEFAEKVNENLRSGDEREATEQDFKLALEREEKLADMLLENLENYPDLPTDWKQQLSLEDKLAIIKKAHTFVIDEDKKKLSLGKTIIATACYFNGEVSNQLHILRKKTIDDSSAYALLISKQYKPIKGKKFGQNDAVEFVLQDEAKAKLYDSMQESVKGFAKDKVPMRVKILVIDDIFASLDLKK